MKTEINNRTMVYTLQDLANYRNNINNLFILGYYDMNSYQYELDKIDNLELYSFINRKTN